MNIPRNINRSNGFTLVEMLVAMALTLLMMAALSRAFGFVGEAVRDSRADVEMSGRLTDINARLADELSRCTVSLTPALNRQEPLGYFLYSEGPITDVTSSLFKVFDNADGTQNLSDGRYGDFDDYLAFTAVAKGNEWFTGKVPRFVLDMKTVDLLPINNDAVTTNDVVYNPTSFPGGPLDPIVIESKYAEIVYFASPEYFVDDTMVASTPSVPPFLNGFVDADANGFPDRIKLHRRVLLIRPDLALDSQTNAIGTQGSLGVYTSGAGSSALQWMRPDDWPTGNNSVWTNIAGNSSTSVPDIQAWRYSMAGVHQQCDLSLRRVLDSDGSYMDTVAPNALADLSQPHNRFAHMRAPSGAIGGAGSYPTSMPILALDAPLAVLGATTAAAIQLPPPLGPGPGPVVTPHQFSGFLRPEFVLGYNYSHRELTGDSWGRERLGEDVLTNNALALDVQIFDPDVTIFTGTNGLVVGPNDAGYRETILQDIGDAPTGASTFGESSSGGFVDLAYPVLAGGSLRGWASRLLDRRGATTATVLSTRNYLNTPFSAVSQNSTGNYVMTDSVKKSGRLVADASGDIRIFQPAFDTYTLYYETDGVEQDFVSGGYGRQWSTTTGLNVDRGSDGLDGDANAGADDIGERETLPPFLTAAEAVRVTIRVENAKTRQVRQASVVHRD